jgi:hypothetical protein
MLAVLANVFVMIDGGIFLADPAAGEDAVGVV